MRNKTILGILAALMLIMGGCGGKSDAFTYKGVPILPEGQLAMIDGNLYGRPFVRGKMMTAYKNSDKLARYDIHTKKNTVIEKGEGVSFGSQCVLIGDYLYSVGNYGSEVHIYKIGIENNTFEVFAAISASGRSHAARMDDQLLVSGDTGRKSYIWAFDTDSGKKSTLISKSDKEKVSIRAFDYDEKNEKIYAAIYSSDYTKSDTVEIYSKDGERERSVELDFLWHFGSKLRVMGDYIYISDGGWGAFIAHLEGDELVPVAKIGAELRYIKAAKDWGGERREGLEFFYATKYPYLFIFDYETGEMRYIDFGEIYGFEFIGPVLPDGDNVWFFGGKSWSSDKYYYYYGIDDLLELDVREFPRYENGDYNEKALADKYKSE